MQPERIADLLTLLDRMAEWILYADAKGAFPGGEPLVRDILQRLEFLGDEMGFRKVLGVWYDQQEARAAEGRMFPGLDEEEYEDG